MAASTRIVVLDTETTGLDPHVHQITEISWMEHPGGTLHTLIPPHTLEHADADALRISRYADRIAGAPVCTLDDLTRLWFTLGGDGVPTTLAGFNPRFDSAFLEQMFARNNFNVVSPWRRRLLDVAVYAYALLPFPTGHIPSLADAVAACGVANDLPHSAASDVQATADVLTHLDTVRTTVSLEPRP